MKPTRLQSDPICPGNGLLGHLVNVGYHLLAVVVAPILLYRSLTTGKYRQGWDQRRGLVPTLAPGKKRVWIHAVSVGETNAVAGLLDQWRKQDPDIEFILSTTTDTGQARARKLFPELTVIRYPLDFRRWVRRSLDRIKPTMIVLVELELWYQFVTLAAARGIPVVVINGRLSERSVRRFGWIRPVAHRMFQALDHACVQDRQYRDRFLRMGMDPSRITVTGSLKWDTAEIADHIPGSEQLARAMGIDSDRPLWVCGSTGPGEEAVILEVYQTLRTKHPTLQLALVPRKPERFDDVAGQIEQAGFRCLRRSQTAENSPAPTHTSDTILLGDTMGELRKLYSLATVVFVGRTLAPMGGSDMMEVAALAKPVVVGPHTENFAETMTQLRQGQGIVELDDDLTSPATARNLAAAVDKLLANTEYRRTVGDNGRQIVQANRGSTQRTLNPLTEILARAQHRFATTTDEQCG